jgi:hypothetical protein
VSGRVPAAINGFEVFRVRSEQQRKSVLVAKAHGHIVAEPCEECGRMISTGRMEPFSMDHAESCSHHSSKVPPGRFFVEGGLGVDGKIREWINGVEQTSCPRPVSDEPPSSTATDIVKEAQALSPFMHTP